MAFYINLIIKISITYFTTLNNKNINKEIIERCLFEKLVKLTRV